MAVGGARLGGLQQLQMPPREDLNLPEEGPPESARAGAGAETPPEGTEQEVRAWTSVAGGEKAVARWTKCVLTDKKSVSGGGVVGVCQRP